jgi:hypothetical protein
MYPGKNMPTDFKSSMSLAVNTIFLKDVAMKINKSIFVTALVSLIMISVNGVVLAKDAIEMSDKESCEQEAKESGLVDKEFQEFVTQCLEEIHAQNMVDSKPATGE